MNGENFWATDRVWKRLGGTALLAALLAWGFASSEALLPLRVVAEYPAEIGRALATSLFGGHAAWPRLMPAGGRSLPGSELGRFFVGALGILFGLLGSALALSLACAPSRARWAARALGALLIVASLFPPYGLVESLPVLISGAALLGIGALATPEGATQALLLGAAWSGLAPLWQMEGPLFRSGRPGPDVDALAQATGQPALLWAVVGAGLCVLAWRRVLRPPPPAPALPLAPQEPKAIS